MEPEVKAAIIQVAGLWVIEAARILASKPN